MAAAMQTEDFPYLPSGPAEVNKLIKEHGDLFSDSQCKVCSAVLISESQKLTHYQSKKHANKVRRYLSIQTEKEPALKKFRSSSDSVSKTASRWTSRGVLSPTLNAATAFCTTFSLHCNSSPAVASQTPPTVQPKKKPADDVSGVPAPGGNNNSNPDRFCSICQASFNNPLMAQQHYVGKKHRKQMTKLKLMETYGPSTAPASTLKGYPCTVCSIELNSVEQYQSHISGAKHKNQVKKSGLTPAENQDAAAEQSYEGDNQYAGGREPFPAADEQYRPVEEQYAARDNQYAPEDTEYTEEYQFT
ncbi:zinc finger protein 346 [Etheostoma cragini]|uniref:zinc finger protein 346 n=1 Tax=Etheostoma cragini TaxID=417921 RepID=UPI00155F1339|nr:zinc finger protein 346 [Etheostoma cragini]